MPIPHRMNLVPIEIILIAKEGRVTSKDRPHIDPTYRRPRGEKLYKGVNNSDVLNLDAQIFYQRQEDKFNTDMGDSPRTDGNLTMRKTDFEDLKEQPIKGDLIVKIDDDDVEYEIVEVRHAGYLRGRSNLIMMFFKRSKEKVGRP